MLTNQTAVKFWIMGTDFDFRLARLLSGSVGEKAVRL
jgi:hypothetical protein